MSGSNTSWSRGTESSRCRRTSYVGYEYEQYADRSCSSSLKHFTDTLEEEPLTTGDLSAPLDQKGITALKSLNGCMSYGTGNRPDMAGRVAVSQQNGGESPVVRDLKYANTQLRAMKNYTGSHLL